MSVNQHFRRCAGQPARPHQRGRCSSAQVNGCNSPSFRRRAARPGAAGNSGSALPLMVGWCCRAARSAGVSFPTSAVPAFELVDRGRDPNQPYPQHRHPGPANPLCRGRSVGRDRPAGPGEAQHLHYDLRMGLFSRGFRSEKFGRRCGTPAVGQSRSQASAALT